jgi:vacuolar-type H+-ATPase subunit I/STV1
MENRHNTSEMSDQRVLDILKNAEEKAAELYQENPNKENLEAWEAALSSIENRTADKTRPAEVNGSAPEQEEQAQASWSAFRDTASKADVLRFLLSAGYKVASRTFYRHCKTGLLNKNNDGFYTRRLVKKYAENNLEHEDPDIGTAGELEVQKKQAEISRIRTIDARERFRLEKEKGNYLDRTLLGFELASRLVMLDNGFRNLVNAKSLKWIVQAGGDQNKIPDLIESMLADWDGLLDKYADMETLELIFEQGEE